MKTALFVMLPVISHYNACFGLAATLREQGERVVFTGTPDLRDYVEREGFAFVPMRYLEEYVLPNVRVALGLFLKSSLDKTFAKSRYREFYGCVRFLEQLCRQIAPTAVYLDQHLNHYFFLLPTVYRNVVLLNTKLPTRRAKGIPPLTSSTVVRQNLVGMLYSQLLWWQLTTAGHFHKNYGAL